MRDPYLYDDADVLRNLAGIKDGKVLRAAEADITNLSMAAVYARRYATFDTETLSDIHRGIFGQIYDWAGSFRTIQIIKYEEVIGGDTVRYSYPCEIKKRLDAAMRELAGLKRTGDNDRDLVFRLVRIIAQIWQIHPFREGNTRTVMTFAVLYARSLGFDVDHDLFRVNSSYVHNALVWASQGIYSRYGYLEKIFFDAVLHEDVPERAIEERSDKKYEKIEGYRVREYKEQPHRYFDAGEEQSPERL